MARRPRKARKVLVKIGGYRLTYAVPPELDDLAIVGAEVSVGGLFAGQCRGRIVRRWSLYRGYVHFITNVHA